MFISNSYLAGLGGYSNLPTASMAIKVKFDLRFDTRNLSYIGIYVHISWNSHYSCMVASEAKVTSI